MGAVALEHLPADLFGLSDAGREFLSGVPQLELDPPAERFDADERAELAACLEERLAPREPPVAVLDAVRALRDPGVSVVVAEAPPALLGGRLAGLYAGLTAVRLARELTARGGTRTVALLWNLADEHEHAGVHPAHLINPNLDLRKIGLSGMGTGQRPHGTVLLEAEAHRLGPVGELVRQLLPVSEEREGALALCLPRSGETLADALTRALLGLVGPLGLIVAEPAWLRADLSRALARLVGEPPAKPGAEPAAYRLEEGRRVAVRPGGDGWRYDGEPGSRTPAELAAAIVGEPHNFHAGPALRPHVLDAVLPVRARVVGRAGPGASAGADGLAARVLQPSAPRVPRLSATLIDPQTRAALAALGLDVRAVVACGGALAETPEPAPTPPAIAQELRDVAARASDGLLALRGALAEVDRGLAGQLKKLARDLRAPVDSLAARAERVGANRRGGERRHLRRATTYLLPGGEPQEEMLPPLPFVARHGPGWIAALAEEMDARPVEHVAVHIDP